MKRGLKECSIKLAACLKCCRPQWKEDWKESSGEQGIKLWWLASMKRGLKALFVPAILLCEDGLNEKRIESPRDYWQALKLHLSGLNEKRIESIVHTNNVYFTIFSPQWKEDWKFLY